MKKVDSIDFKRLGKSFNDARARKLNWYSQYNLIYQLVIPNRTAFNVFYNYYNAARFENQNIYDTTAMTSAYLRANELQGLLFPQDRMWGSLDFNQSKVTEAQTFQGKSYLDQVNQTIFDYLSASNLSQQGSEMLLDLVGGMGVMKIESVDDDEPIRFTAIPAYCTFVSQNNTTEVNEVWILDQMPAITVLELYPKYKGKHLERLMKNPTDLINVFTGQTKLGDEWYCYTFIDDHCEENIIWEDTYYFKLINVIRDHVHPGEVEGRGVAMDMIWVIRSLNLIMRDNDQGLTMRVRPPIFVDQTQPFNPNSFRGGLAGAFIPTRGGNAPMQALQIAPCQDLQMQIMDKRSMIQKAFQVDPLGSIQDTPDKTATEVSIRQNNAQKTMTTDMGRLIHDGPAAFYHTALQILVKRGIISLKVGELKNSRHLLFQFKSPLFDLQKAQNLQNFATIATMLQQYFGEGAVLGALDEAEVREYLIENGNVPHKLFKSPEAIQKLMKTMGQMATNTAANQGGQPGQAQPGGLPAPTTEALPLQSPMGQQAATQSL